MTRAELVSMVVASTMAQVVGFGYLLDAIGVGIAPLWVFLLSGAGTAVLMWRRSRPARHGASDVLAWAGVVALVLAAVVRLGWPSLLLPGRGPDLTHHLVLVDYIERQRHLVHDRSLDGTMGEMAHYTPGAHLLAVIAGDLFGVDGLRAFFPLLALSLAWTAGLVFLSARRLDLQAPYAIAAVLLLFLPGHYFHGAFTHDGFLAQTVATFFAVAAWWAIVVWEERRTLDFAALFSIFIVATFLTWPVYIGPLLLTFAGCVLASKVPAASWRAQAATLAIGVLPLIIVAAIHVAGRWGWIAIVRTDGAVLRPGFDSVGWLLPLLTIIGVHVSMRNHNARSTMVLLFAIVLQAITLFVMARTQGAATPYMAFKMVYLAIYPMAVLGAAGLSIIRRVLGDRDAPVAWAFATALVLVAVRPSLLTPRPVPVVDLDLYAAGKWTRASGGAACVDYLVSDAQTAYWMHLAVLGNSRSSARMQDVDRYDPRAAMGSWITAGARRNAIADLRLLPDDVRSRVEIIKTFGHAAVVSRAGLPADVKMGDCDLGR